MEEKKNFDYINANLNKLTKKVKEFKKKYSVKKVNKNRSFTSEEDLKSMYYKLFKYFIHSKYIH